MQYGGSRSAWETLAPGQSITISAAPPAITSAATATAEVGSAFTFAVTTSGTAPVTLAETGDASGRPDVHAGSGCRNGHDRRYAGGRHGRHLPDHVHREQHHRASRRHAGLLVVRRRTEDLGGRVVATRRASRWQARRSRMSYLVTNTGNVTLVGAASPTRCRASRRSRARQTTLLVGASETCSVLYAVTQADVDAGGIHLAATASGPDRAVDHGRARNVQRHHSGDPGTRDRGDAVVESRAASSERARQLAFNYLVTNSGNVTLHGIGVSRPADRPVGDQLSEPDARAGRDRVVHGDLHDERRPT